MNIKATFDHYNFNVYDLEKSLEFYEKALGFKELNRNEAPDGSFILVFLTDGSSNFTLELTWLAEWNRPYEMGDNEVHLCVRVAGDYAQVREYHRSMGCICYENEAMELYFISDLDNHWIEILPEKR